jgi:hypothetical protein
MKAISTLAASTSPPTRRNSRTACGFVAHHILRDGLTVGLWTAPFEVSSRAWVYEHHKDWLVHNAKGQPIPLEDCVEAGC